MAIASRNIGRSVKWVEDQLEHLIAVSSAANRITTLEAAVSETGEVLAIDCYQLED
jgi:2-furoyl-CoA dehydrogenase large subunit